MEKESTMGKNMCDYSKALEIVEIILICIATFLVPTFLAQLIQLICGETSWAASHSQYIVGTVVNTALIVAALNIKGWKKNIGIIMLPSISTVLSGYVFKSASVYTAYMIPAIWLGNFSIVYLYKLLLLKKNLNYFLTGIIAIVVKVAIIFAGYNLVNLTGVFPEAVAANLKVAMSTIQAVTATCGMIIASSVYFANKNALKKESK